MADVQIDNGQFTRIANVLLEKISQAKLNGTQYAIILFVWRYTYGFQRCEHKISLSFLSDGIDTDIRVVRREIQKLINANIITVVKESDNVNPRTIKVNKDYETWQVVWRGLKSPERTKKTPPERTKKTPRGEDELVPQERKSFKEKSKDTVMRIFEKWNSKEIIQHKQTGKLMKEVEKGLKKHTEEEIDRAINNYAEVYNSSFYYSHKWRLDKFLNQANGVPEFLPEGGIWENYLSNKPKEEELPAHWRIKEPEPEEETEDAYPGLEKEFQELYAKFGGH